MEVGVEAARVVLQQVHNPFFAGRRHNQPGMVRLADARDDLRIRIAAHVGRFLTRDPLGGWEDLGHFGNAVTYARNNPQTMVDPTGLTAINMHCTGEWPAPRTVKTEYDDCSGTREDLVAAMSCIAFKAVGRAYADVKRLVEFD